ncbi:MAG: glycosyltransferase [Lachnospiraceae bacterium]|uniref:Glycosyltransferase n=1 Tax=Candidatus Weimeria bifida TaxID=2599074 RepID=A0A6N7IZG3_9FIRM|nr:glycosyltransferase [Candidatus Weimeria bifida]RRF96598.1 MAG: glycosyltransferase [Lachnospiraceae bacterium]
MKKENTQPLLSISLLCSGRNKDEMVKCLDSLMTIRNRMSSEIVIVDTGCGPDTKPLLSKYADKVVEFKWCNDFAKARNAGVKECTGQWFMFVDDDEWFENTDDIVDFFNSGEYKSYGIAKYIIRNYKDYEGKKYTDAWNPRIVKKVSGLEFHGKIHEYPQPVSGKVKGLNCFVHHYGYVFTDQKILFEKSNRNIPLLKEMMQKEPYNPYWRIQLVQEYNSTHDYNALEELCLNSNQMIVNRDDELTNKFRCIFYEGILISEIQTYQYDKLFSNLKEFLSDMRNTEKAETGLCFYAVIGYWEKKNYRKVYYYARKYLENYDKISLTEDTSIDDMTFMCGNIFDQNRILYCISRAIAAGVRCGDISVLYDYFDRFDLTYQYEPVVTFCEGLTYAFSHFDFNQKFVEYASKACKNPFPCKLLMDDARKAEKDDKKAFDKLVEVYGKTDSTDDIYLLYMRLLYAYRFDRSKLSDMYQLIFDCVIDFFDMDPCIWDIAAEDHIDLLQLFKDVPFIRWKKATDLLMVEHFEERTRTVKAISDIIEDDNDIRFEYFRLKLEEHDLRKIDDVGKVAALLTKYCSDCVTFYLNIYKPELFVGDLTILPQECQFAMRFIETASSEQKHTPVEHMKALEECAALYDPFTETMKTYISAYGEKKKRELAGQL